MTGPSGSGKSTLLAVLLGFLPAAPAGPPVTGPRLVPPGGTPVRFNLRGNLLLGLPGTRHPRRPAGSRAPGLGVSPVHGTVPPQHVPELGGALAAVGLVPWWARLHDGLDTRIGPGGSFLSGGERQRLAVARTLMTGAEVILLDEPTAHLDAESGRDMLAELRAGLKDRTVVMVTHNPADIRPADTLLDLSAASLTGAGGGARVPYPEGSLR